MRAEKVKRNLTASGDGSEVSTAGPGVKRIKGMQNDHPKMIMEFSFSSLLITNLNLPHNNVSG